MPKRKATKQPPNALKHGVFAETIILPGEDPKDFERLHRDLIKEWSPSGPSEHDAVLTLAKLMWRKRRIRHLRQDFSLKDAQKLSKLALNYSFAAGPHDEVLNKLSLRSLEEFEKMLEENEMNEKNANDWFQAGNEFLLHLNSMDALKHELAIEDRIDAMMDRALRRLGHIKAMKEVMALKENVPKQLARTARQIAAPSTIAASS